MDFLDRFLNAGGADKIDIVSFHAYFSPSGDGLAEYIDNIRGALKEHGLGDKPLWNTEAAPTCTVDRRSCAEPGLREVDQDSAILKAALIMRAKAVNNFTYYNFEIPTEEARLVDRVDPNQLTLRGRAFVQTTSFLANATIVDSFVYKGVYAVRLQFGNHIKTVLWSNAENRTVRLPVDWRATTGNFWMSTSNKVDPAGTVTLGRRPILIE
jgi:hypothetical protein